MIEVHRLTKRYGDRTAIEDVTFRVERGEVLGFLGPNGAGKTTTMRILTGFMPPTQGTARVAGYDVLEHPTEVKRRIGYLPEHPPLYPELTVREYLSFVAAIKGVPRGRIARALDHVVEQCGLQEVRHRVIRHLSRGYQQRVGLAQALVHDPEVLVLDEPTLGLDPRQIAEIRRLIKALAGERTVILSSHILPEVTATCGRVVIIHEGRVVATDTLEGLTARLRGAEQLSLRLRRPGPDVARRLEALPGVRRVVPAGDGTYTVESALGQDVREAVARCAVEADWGLLELTSLAMSLEDVFLKLTTEEPSPDRPAGGEA